MVNKCLTLQACLLKLLLLPSQVLDQKFVAEVGSLN